MQEPKTLFIPEIKFLKDFTCFKKHQKVSHLSDCITKLNMIHLDLPQNISYSQDIKIILKLFFTFFIKHKNE